MKRILNGLILTILILSVSVSCNNNSDNIFGCHVDKVHAEKSIHLNASSVLFEKQPLIEVINLHTIDSFLVVKGNVKDCAGQMFIFNLNDKKYTGGSFISKGIGPNELLKPCCLGQYGNSSEQNSLYIFDLSYYKAYSFNVEESVKRGETVLSEICKLPDGTLYAYPFRDSLHFIKKPGPDCLDGMVLNQHGGLSETVALYRDIPGLMYFDKLSSADAFFQGTDIMAMAMTMLPQVNFIDLKSGARHTTAINRHYRKWKQILLGEFHTQTICYTAAVQAGDMVVALYYGISMKEWAAGNIPAHLHIFNSEGRFLYDISVNQTLKAICFDNNSRVIYGVDKDDNIYQYDFSSIIQ